jgi:hypothetical protein
LEELLRGYPSRDIKKVVLASECLQDCKCKRGLAGAGKALDQKGICVALNEAHQLVGHVYLAAAAFIIAA